jgi:hypothetical protein
VVDESKVPKTKKIDFSKVGIGFDRVERAKLWIKEIPENDPHLNDAMDEMISFCERRKMMDESKAPEVTKKTGTPKYVHDDAKRLWLLARLHLDKILKEDASREAVFEEMMRWLLARMQFGKIVKEDASREAVFEEVLSYAKTKLLEI